MRRASKSVVEHIVEGYSHKDTPVKMKSFWRISMGSANEMIEHLEQTALLKYAPTEIIQPMIDEYTVVAKQLNKLIQNWYWIPVKRSHSNFQYLTSNIQEIT